MLSTIATLTFLTMMWLVIAIVAATIRENADRICSALRGEGLRPTPIDVRRAGGASSWRAEESLLPAAA